MTVLNETSTLQGYLVTITGTIPEAWSIDLCSADMHMDGYQPNVLTVGDLPLDGGGFIRTSLILLNYGPFRISTYTYETFAEFLRDWHIWGATVEITRQGWLRDGTIETSLRVTGQITKPSHFGRSTVTLEVEQRGLSDFKVVPQRTIDSSLFNGASYQNLIPDDGKGETIPVPFGKSVPIPPSPLYSLTDAKINSVLVRGGLKPKGFPIREVQRESQKRSYAWAEDIGALDVQTTFGHSDRVRNGFVYFPAADAYASFYEQATPGAVPNWTISDSSWAPEGTGLAWRAVTKRSPILQIPLLCSSVDEDASSDLYDGKNAIDGKAETYATLDHRGDTAGGAFFFFPTGIPKLGRIITNSVDNGTGRQDLEQWEPRPAGLRIFCVVVAPPGHTIPTADIVMWPVFPFVQDALFASDYADIVIPSGIGGAEITTLNLNVCAGDGHVGTQGDGWWGTKFHQWDFTSSPDEDQSDVHSSDFPLSLDGELDVAPFRVKISNLSGNAAPVKIQAVGLIVSFEWDGFDTIGYPVDYRSKTRSSQEYIAYVGPVSRDPGRYSPDRDNRLWSRSPGSARANHLPAPTSPSGIIISTDAFIDDASGTYSGVASLRPLLENPAQIAHYFMRAYSGESVKTRTSTEHGAWGYPESDLNWWEHRVDPTTSFRAAGSIDTQAPVADVIDHLFTGLPEVSYGKDRDGEWSFHIWVPRAGGQWNASRYYGDSATTPLEPEKYLVATPDEGIQLWTDGGDLSSLINEIEVAYDYDIGSGKYLRTATLKQKGSTWVSDDGYGDPWPAAYGSGATAEAMAKWSYDHFGQVRRPSRIELPFVHHRPSAVSCGLYHLWRFYRPAPRLYFEARTGMSDLLMWQILRWDNTLWTYWKVAFPWRGIQPDTPDGGDWDQNFWRVVKIEMRESPGATILVEAEWMPQTIGGEIGGGFAGFPESPDEEIVDSNLESLP